MRGGAPDWQQDLKTLFEGGGIEEDWTALKVALEKTSLDAFVNILPGH